jgi:hypothetical protein
MHPIVMDGHLLKKKARIGFRRNLEMKFIQYLASFAVVALVLSLNAFAKDSNSGKFTLSDTVEVGSARLAPGSYKAEWNGPANDLKIEIMKNGKTVATAQGKVQDLQKPAPYTAVLTRTRNDTKQLHEIEFDKHTEAIVLGGE